MALFRKKPISVVLVSGSPGVTIPAVLDRYNISYVSSLLSPIDRPKMVVHRLDRGTVRAEIVGRLVDVPVGAFSTLKGLAKSDKIELLSLDDELLSVRIKTLGFDLSGPPELVAASAGELNSEIYYWEVDVRNKVVVDVGGFIGDSALFFISRGARKVYVSEPSRRYFEFLAKNLSSYRNIEAENIGLWSADASSTLSGEGMSEKVGLGGRELVELRDFSTYIKGVLAREGRVGLLKIDCEGCEWEITGKINAEVAENIEAIYLEVHGERADELAERYCRLGYAIRTKKHVGPQISNYLLTRSHSS